MGTSFYLHFATAPSAVTSGSDTKLLADSTIGSQSPAKVSNKNSVAGPTAPIQHTDGQSAGTDGTPVSWYTHPLAAATLSAGSDSINATLYGLESATNKNMAPCIRVEVVNGDGSSKGSPIVLINQAVSQTTLEWTASIAGKSVAPIAVSGTITAGDRLKINLYEDDAADQGGSGSMGSGGSAQIQYDASAVNNGATRIFVSQTLTELSEAAPFVAKPLAPVTWAARQRSGSR